MIQLPQLLGHSRRGDTAGQADRFSQGKKLLERCLVPAIEITPFTIVGPEATIQQVVDLMAERKIAAVIVADCGELQGIFTERDVLNRVADVWSAMRHEPVRKVMTADPFYLLQNDSVATALAAIVELGYRHYPVLNSEQKIVGIVSPQRILRFFTQQLHA